MNNTNVNTNTNTFRKYDKKKYNNNDKMVYKVYLYNDTDDERSYYSYFFDTFEDAKEFGFEVKNAANDVSKRKWSFWIYKVTEAEA